MKSKIKLCSLYEQSIIELRNATIFYKFIDIQKYKILLHELYKAKLYERYKTLNDKMILYESTIKSMDIFVDKCI